MVVIRRLGLILAFVGLGVVAVAVFHGSSYSWGSAGPVSGIVEREPATDCGSIVFPKNTDDEICEWAHDEVEPMVGWASAAIALGAGMYLVGRFANARSSDVPSRNEPLDV